MANFHCVPAYIPSAMGINCRIRRNSHRQDVRKKLYKDERLKTKTNSANLLTIIKSL
jgi:hypothetical protein